MANWLLNNKKYLITILSIITTVLAIISFTTTHLKYSAILNGFTVISLLLTVFLIKSEYDKYETNQFIIKITDHFKKMNIFIEPYKKRNNVNADIVVFLPNRILLFYPLQYKGTIYVNENILTDKKKPLPNITKIQQNIDSDKLLISKEFQTFCENNFYQYEYLDVVPVVYVPNSTIKQSYEKPFAIINQYNLQEMLNYNILNDNYNVYDYENFIKHLKQNKMIK